MEKEITVFKARKIVQAWLRKNHFDDKVKAKTWDFSDLARIVF